jgi:hypothetical protein
LMNTCPDLPRSPKTWEDREVIGVAPRHVGGRERWPSASLWQRVLLIDAAPSQGAAPRRRRRTGQWPASSAARE